MLVQGPFAPGQRVVVTVDIPWAMSDRWPLLGRHGGIIDAAQSPIYRGYWFYKVELDDVCPDSHAKRFWFTEEELAPESQEGEGQWQ